MPRRVILRVLLSAFALLPLTLATVAQDTGKAKADEKPKTAQKAKPDAKKTETKPKTDEKPKTETKPAETEKPKPTEKPADTAKPKPTEKPADTEKPKPSEPAKPTEAAKPKAVETPKPTSTTSKAPARSIERLDPKFDDLIAADAKVEELADGFKWTEGPVWDKKNSQLLFTDIPNNVVVKWSAKDGAKEFLKPSGYTGSEAFTGGEAGANGLTFNKDGQLVLCQHGDRRISKWVDGKFVTLVDKYMGKRLNSPNDLVFHPNGDLYFTDPPYGLPKIMEDPKKELDFQGVYRLKPNGDLTLLTKEMSRPNGIALSPDSKTLYVANSDPDKAMWKSFPVKDDGTLGEGKILTDVTDLVKANIPGLPDGLKVDQQGNIWATGPGGVFVFDAMGKLLGVIHTNDKTANCAFGDDGSTLYICANHNMVRIKTKVKGLGF